MRAGVILVTVLALTMGLTGICHAQDEDSEGDGISTDLDFILQARPASLFVDVDGKKFGADGDNLSNVYLMPNVSAGVGIQMEDVYVDLTVGAGMLVNDGFRSFMFDIGVAANYEFSESFSLGPRASLIWFADPEWVEDESVDFDSATGFLVGVQASMGDKISYIVSVDVISASMDAESSTGAVLTEEELDLVGLAFQFGVRGEF